MPYIFPNNESVNLVNSNATVNFSGIDTTAVINKNLAGLLGSDSTDTNDWLTDLSDKWNNFGGNLPDALDLATFSNSKGGGSIFANNSLSSLFSNGFLSSNPYSPALPKYAEKTNVCGDGIKQNGEVCDDGVKNGKSGYCSSDCRYSGEVKTTGKTTTDTQNPNEVVNTISLESFTELSDTISKNLSGGMKILQTSINRASGSIRESQDSLKEQLMKYTSPRTREIMKQIATVAAEIAQYSVIALASAL